ncbi:NAD(P)H-dependent oxidoreductase [Rhodospirillaceae bacterium KN72]|uniref:NAD(P)H-dependent oxidoreductase n=1 Tax=Pacificispira spongiicola TaxID=2729598 RepID=A0A7Y0HF35_9PROT|nr:NAD(P)H-dependent oxidoreductase [Pacificispira spongiicola]NMM45380.1 NAD(P)H-dependent oxidoreductase [Pacificispira spongiicola]
MTQPKLLAFAGSTRKGSLNEAMLRVAVAGAQAEGADVTHVTLADYPMPLFNQDLEAEQGEPDGAARLKTLFAAADGLLIACPEYNGSITPLLKNTLDWVSRKDAGGPGGRYYKGKTAGLISASAGRLGGMRGLVHVRQILTNLGAVVIPEQLAVFGADKLFGDDGVPEDEARAEQLRDVGGALARTTAKLIG